MNSSWLNPRTKPVRSSVLHDAASGFDALADACDACAEDFAVALERARRIVLVLGSLPLDWEGSQAESRLSMLMLRRACEHVWDHRKAGRNPLFFQFGANALRALASLPDARPPITQAPLDLNRPAHVPSDSVTCATQPEP